jgi:hypothetical protein
MNNYTKYKILQLCDSSIHVGDILAWNENHVTWRYKVVSITNYYYNVVVLSLGEVEYPERLYRIWHPDINNTSYGYHKIGI